MPDYWWIWLAAAFLLSGVLYFGERFWQTRSDSRFAEAQRTFHTRREWLEAEFIQLASAKSKRNSPRWEDCEFSDDVSYVRHRASGELSAFVAVSIAMEDPDCFDFSRGEAIGKMQLGTAVFRFDRGHWRTEGRTILNLSPTEAVEFYQNDWKIVGQEYARRASC